MLNIFSVFTRRKPPSPSCSYSSSCSSPLPTATSFLEVMRYLKSKTHFTTSLQDLQLQNSVQVEEQKLTDEDLEFLLQTNNNNHSIERLYLAGNLLTDRSCHALGSFLKENPNLKTLGLSVNSIGDESAKSLCRAMNKNNHLRWLFLEANEITNAGVEAIIQDIRQSNNSTLEAFCLQGSINITNSLLLLLRKVLLQEEREERNLSVFCGLVSKPFSSQNSP